MNKVFTIARWEYIEKVRSKSFIISLFVTPIIIIAFTVLPMMLAGHEEDVTKAYGILDSTGVYVEKLSEEMKEYTLPNDVQRYVVINLFPETISYEEAKASANEHLKKDEIEAYIFIGGKAHDSLIVEMRGKSIGSFHDLARFENKLNKVRRDMIIEQAQIEQDLGKQLSSDVKVSTVKIDEKGKEKEISFESEFMSSLIFIMLLFFIIVYTGGSLIRSLVEEKSNRIIEIIISSCRPEDLLAGKIAGLTMLLLTQIAVWGAIAFPVAGSSVLLFANLENVLLLLYFFLLGFIFYTSIFVGVGSIVNTEQEAQQMTSYLSMALISPVVVLVPLMQNPNSTLIQILSYIPFTAPPVMIARLNITEVSKIEVLISGFILIVSIYLAIRIAAKVFRIGILSYGKLPSLKELSGWLKQSS